MADSVLLSLSKRDLGRKEARDARPRNVRAGARRQAGGECPAGGRPAAGYAVAAYAISWACWLPLAFAHRVVRVGAWPTHLPGLLGPALAAVLLSALVGGRAGVANLGRRVFRWRIGAWWLMALSPLGVLGVVLAARVATGHGLPRWSDFGAAVQPHG